MATKKAREADKTTEEEQSEDKDGASVESENTPEGVTAEGVPEGEKDPGVVATIGAAKTTKQIVDEAEDGDGLDQTPEEMAPAGTSPDTAAIRAEVARRQGEETVYPLQGEQVPFNAGVEVVFVDASDPRIEPVGAPVKLSPPILGGYGDNAVVDSQGIVHPAGEVPAGITEVAAQDRAAEQRASIRADADASGERAREAVDLQQLRNAEQKRAND